MGKESRPPAEMHFVFLLPSASQPVAAAGMEARLCTPGQRATEGLGLNFLEDRRPECCSSWSPKRCHSSGPEGAAPKAQAKTDPALGTAKRDTRQRSGGTDGPRVGLEEEERVERLLREQARLPDERRAPRLCNAQVRAVVVGTQQDARQVRPSGASAGCVHCLLRGADQVLDVAEPEVVQREQLLVPRGSGWADGARVPQVLERSLVCGASRCGRHRARPRGRGSFLWDPLGLEVVEEERLAAQLALGLLELPRGGRLAAEEHIEDLCVSGRPVARRTFSCAAGGARCSGAYRCE